MSHEDLPRIVEEVGPNCLVLGTDFGHTDSGTEIEAHRFVEARADISDTVKENILSRNARRLFGL
jgi:predicted TIM-barrel fold metal-dependent hydrolase